MMAKPKKTTAGAAVDDWTAAERELLARSTTT